MASCNPHAISPYNDAAEFPLELFTQYQLSHGAILIHVVASIYIFYVMFLICDEYLVPAIETLCDVLHLPSHIAGASFLAASSSIPELFVNLIGTFLTKNDLGIGTILASAFFNLLVIVALTGFGTAILGTTMSGVKYNTIALWPLLRDSIVYAMALIALTIVIWDKKVYLYEALTLVLLYFLYILGLFYNNALEHLGRRFGHFLSSIAKRCHCHTDPEKMPILHKKELEEGTGTGTVEETDDERDDREIKEQDQQDRDLILNALQEDSKVFVSGTQKGKWTPLFLPTDGSCFEWIHYVMIFPGRLLIIATVPDCRSENSRKWFPCTLILSVAWMGTLSYFASFVLIRFGTTVGFPNSITGIFLALGASFPEVLASFIVARKGLGTMGLSNPIGSNTFDILICLGLPWTIQGLLKSTNYVHIQSSGVHITVLLLLFSLFLLNFILVVNRLVLDLNVAVIALIIYVFAMTFVCLTEMNVFFNVNLKPC